MLVLYESISDYESFYEKWFLIRNEFFLWDKEQKWYCFEVLKSLFQRDKFVAKF